ncbi:hypothetical protein CsSME_00014779 [Camellia sinensis var. sinensis]
MADEPIDSTHPSCPAQSSNVALLGVSLIPIVNKLQDIFAQFEITRS